MTLGDYLQYLETTYSRWGVYVSAAGVLATIYIGYLQTEINKSLERLQSFVEIFCQPNSNTGVSLVNAGNQVVYVHRVTVNGASLHDGITILPPHNVGKFDIALHEARANIELLFEDLNQQKWITKIVAEKQGERWNPRTAAKVKA